MAQVSTSRPWGSTTIVGLARAKACNLAGLMAKSGMDGVFVEPVGRTGNGPSYGVRWEEQKVGENRADYFKRVLALRDKAGIVVGRRQLGVRTEVRPEDQMRSWRLTGAPKHWSTDTVTEVLEGAGLQNIALSSRLLRRSACSWFFRAKGTEECVHVPVKDGEATFDLYILPATVARRAPGARQPLRPERAQQFTKEKFATTVEPQRDMETTDDGKEQPGGKRRAQEVRELPSGVRLEKQPADGNCLAHCLGTGLTWLKGDQKKRPARLVRSELYTFLKGQADNFAPFWDGRNCGDELAPNMTFAEYLAEMSMEGKYLGCLELEAASKAFRVTIVVIPTDAGIPPTRHGHYDRLLALWYSGKHYDLLLPATGQDSYPAAITGVQAFGEKSGGRGGGADSEAEEAERLTVYTASSAPQAGATRARRQLKRQPSHDSVATHITLFSLWGGAKRGRPEPERASRHHTEDPEAGSLDNVERASVSHQGAIRNYQKGIQARTEDDIELASALPQGAIQNYREGIQTAGEDCTVHPSEPLRGMHSDYQEGIQADSLAGAAHSSELAPGGSHDNHEEHTQAGVEDVFGEVLELVEPPPKPDRRDRGARNFWRCEECGWDTGHTPKWSKLKTYHIRKFHPELRDELGPVPPSLTWVPWSPECCWKCPIPGCGLGLKGAAGLDAKHRARMQHRADAHPGEPKDRFFLEGSAAENAGKASVAVRNRGAAERIRALELVREAGHEPVWLSYPIPPPKGPRKKLWKEGLLHRIFCRVCKQGGLRPGDLANKACAPGDFTPTSLKMVRRLRERIKQDGPAEILAACRHTIEFFEQAQQEQQEQTTAEHEEVAVAWPGTSWHVKFLCKRCKKVSDQPLRPKCGKLGFSGRPLKHFAELQPVATGKPGAAADAARRILDMLGYDWNKDAATHGARQRLAAGLGQGRAP